MAQGDTVKLPIKDQARLCHWRSLIRDRRFYRGIRQHAQPKAINHKMIFMEERAVAIGAIIPSDCEIQRACITSRDKVRSGLICRFKS